MAPTKTEILDELRKLLEIEPSSGKKKTLARLNTKDG